MARLIDANVVLAKQFAAGLSDASGNYYGNADVVFADDIENAPTLDAVEVVRCRDCKHLVLTSEGEHNPCDCVCDHWMTDGLNDNDFCSYGERKDGGGNG